MFAPAFVEPNRRAWRMHPSGVLWFRPIPRGHWEIEIADAEDRDVVLYWVWHRGDPVATGHAETEPVAMAGAWRAFVREFAAIESGPVSP